MSASRESKDFNFDPHQPAGIVESFQDLAAKFREQINKRADIRIRPHSDGSIEISYFSENRDRALLTLTLSTAEGRILSDQLREKIAEAALCAEPAPHLLIKKFAELLDKPEFVNVLASVDYFAADSSEARDSATNLRTKSAVLSDNAVTALNQRFGPKKLVSYIDFNHMKIPNQFGLTAEVDLLIRELPQIFEQAFDKKSDFELIRLGGDEFLVVSKDNEMALEALELVKVGIEEKRKQIFPSSEARVRLAERVAALREEERSLRDQFWKSVTAEATLADFSDWLIKNFVSEQKFRDMLIAEPLRPEAVQFLIAGLNVLRRGDKMGREYLARNPILSISSATARVQGELTPHSLLGALSDLGKAVAAQKRDPALQPGTEIVNYQASELSPSAEQLSEYREFQSHSELYKETRAKIQKELSLHNVAQQVAELRQYEAQDSAVPTLSRFGLAREQKLIEFLGITHPTLVTVFSFDIRGFASINNVLGTDVGDETVRKISEIARKRLPKFSALRIGGGGIVAIVPRQLDQTEATEYMQACFTEMNEYLEREFGADVRVLAEFLEKKTVDGYASAQRASLEESTEAIIKELKKEHELEGRMEEALPDTPHGSHRKLGVKPDLINIWARPDATVSEFAQQLALFQRPRSRASNKPTHN